MSTSSSELCAAALAMSQSIARRLRANVMPPAGHDPKAFELRMRIWSTCVALETLHTAVLGCPTTVRAAELPDALLPVVPPPEEGEPINRLAFYVEGLKSVVP